MNQVASFYICVRQFSNSSIRKAALVKPPVPVFGVAGRYATALFSAASKEKKLDSVEKELVNLEGASKYYASNILAISNPHSTKSLIKTDKKLAEFLMNPLTKSATKKEALAKSLAKKNFGPVTINLLGVMSDNGRLKDLNSVIDCFKGIMGNIRGEVVCKIISAKPLDAPIMKEFEDSLKGFVKKNEKILLQTEVDPSLIGGVILTIGDKYIDMSLASKIKTYSNLIRQPF